MSKKRLLAILGSPHKHGSSAKMLDYVIYTAEKFGYKIDYINLYEKNISYCKGCRTCFKTQMCIYKDDIQEISKLIKNCDTVILSAPVYWANVPAIVKNMFDRLLGVAMEETNTFPKSHLSKKQKFILLTSCNTPFPFSFLCGQSTGAIRAMKEFFKTSGMKYYGKFVWTNTGKQKNLPKSFKKKINRLLS